MHNCVCNLHMNYYRDDKLNNVQHVSMKYLLPDTFIEFQDPSCLTGR